MTDREKLIEILSVPIYPRIGAEPAEVVADYLMDNGVRPERHAHWEPMHKWPTLCCSNCGTAIPTDWYVDLIEPEEVLYCPKCGAKMDEVITDVE